jgi:hypothetical protein
MGWDLLGFLIVLLQEFVMCSGNRDASSGDAVLGWPARPLSLYISRKWSLR